MISRRAADFRFFFLGDSHFDFVENLCIAVLFAESWGCVRTSAAAVDSLRNCFSPVQTLPQPRNEKKAHKKPYGWGQKI